jgi:uncharacterized protein YoxC
VKGGSGGLNIIEISLLIIAIAFVLLVFFIIKTLKSVRGSLDQLNQTMVHMEHQLEDISKESTELLRNTNEITLDIKSKSQSLEGLFHSAENAGQAVQQVTSSFKQVSSTLTESVQRTISKSTEQNQDKMTEIIRYATLGLNIWQKWQARKEKKEHKQEYSPE